MSRKEEAIAAKLKGETQFISAYPCKKCGGVKFKTCNRLCANCKNIRNLAHMRARRSTKEGMAKDLAFSKKWASKNPLHVLFRSTSKRLSDSYTKQRGKVYNEKDTGYSYNDFLSIVGKRPDGYHLDHILPIDWFIKNNILDPKLVASLYNLQWLSPNDNIAKHAKWLPQYSKGMSEWEWCYMLQTKVYGYIKYTENT